VNECKYPNIVELTFPADGLEFELNRRIIGFHKSRTFNRGTGVRSSARTEPIFGGALPIWGQLAISLNNLAGRWPKLDFESCYSRATRRNSDPIVNWAALCLPAASRRPGPPLHLRNRPRTIVNNDLASDETSGFLPIICCGRITQNANDAHFLV